MYNRSISHESNSSDILPEMADIINRIASYHTLPDDVILPASEFSVEGLFFTGRKDRVRCFQCGVRIQDWHVGEKASTRHSELSPRCPIVTENRKSHSRNGGASNYPTSSQKGETLIPNDCNTCVTRNDGSINTERAEDIPHSGTEPTVIRTTDDAINAINTSTSSWYTLRDTSPEAYTQHHTDFTIEANRLGSFVSNWPQDALISPSELASAGLYFTGPGDRVQCAWCRGGLYNWESGDTALGEHKRHFPSCKFVSNKLAELVTSPITSTRVTDSSQLKQDSSLCLQESRVVNIVEDMGYSRETVLQALREIQKNPGAEVSVETLFDAVFDLEEECASGVTVSVEKTQEQTSENGDIGYSSTEMLNEREQEGANNDYLSRDADTELDKNQVKISDEDLGELTEMNKELKEKTMCKVCMDEEVQLVFLPCRHLTCCMDCGRAVKHCPVCRTLILGHVTTSLT